MNVKIMRKLKHTEIAEDVVPTFPIDFGNFISLENIDFIELKPILDLARKHYLTLEISFEEQE